MGNTSTPSGIPSHTGHGSTDRDPMESLTDYQKRLQARLAHPAQRDGDLQVNHWPQDKAAHLEVVAEKHFKEQTFINKTVAAFETSENPEAAIASVRKGLHDPHDRALYDKTVKEIELASHRTDGSVVSTREAFLERYVKETYILNATGAHAEEAGLKLDPKFTAMKLDQIETHSGHKTTHAHLEPIAVHPTALNASVATNHLHTVVVPAQPKLHIPTEVPTHTPVERPVSLAESDHNRWTTPNRHVPAVPQQDLEKSELLKAMGADSHGNVTQAEIDAYKKNASIRSLVGAYDLDHNGLSNREAREMMGTVTGNNPNVNYGNEVRGALAQYGTTSVGADARNPNVTMDINQINHAAALDHKFKEMLAKGEFSLPKCGLLPASESDHGIQHAPQQTTNLIAANTPQGPTGGRS